MTDLEIVWGNYEALLDDIKKRVVDAHRAAAEAINRELVDLYWHIGSTVLSRQKAHGDRLGRGGPRITQRLAADLQAAFPGMRGFSESHIRRMRRFAQAWETRDSIPEVLNGLPWGHHLVMIDKLDSNQERLWYGEQSVAQGWTRKQLEHHVTTELHKRQGAAVSNFEESLGAAAGLAQQITRDPVTLDFLEISDETKERDLENALLGDIERFMLSLGHGFFFAGRQRSIAVGSTIVRLDLLFYHHSQRRFVVIDLKIGEFQAEYAGKMNLYVNAVDSLLAQPEDQPTIGFILCANRDETMTEMSLKGIATPIAVARYTTGAAQLTSESEIPKELAEDIAEIRKVEAQITEFAGRRIRELQNTTNK